MIKRLIYNSETGDISGFLPTDLQYEFVDNNGELFCSCTGDESNVTDLSGSKPLLIAKVTNSINLRTTELIDYGIIYNDIRFWCTQESQQNYTGLYVKKDSPILTYPYTIWDGEGSVSIEDASEMDTFCSEVMTHVQTQRVTGKTLRYSLDDLTEIELLNYEDPRGELSGIV